MRPTAPRLDHYDPKHGAWMGWWGALGSPEQRGVTTYSISANRQNPFAGALHNAIFNTWRRSKNQIGYWLPPMAIAYFALDWATKRNEYLNSKPGRAYVAKLEAEEEAQKKQDS